MKKILVVDNDRFILEFMNDVLTKEGHEVMTAVDGLSALDILKGFMPDVIFVDLIMPNIDGRKLCRIIRATEKIKDVYIVILSAVAVEKGVDVTEFGANACIAKGPIREMAQNILDILAKFDSLEYQSPEIFGRMSVYSRGISKELLAVKRHFEILLGKMTEGVLEINSEGRVVYANPMTITLTGIPEGDLLGADFLDLFAGKDRQRIAESMRAGDEKPVKIDGDSPVCLNNRQITISIVPFRDEENAFIAILNDVSEQKRAEEALKGYQAELEKRVEKRTAELSVANVNLKREVEERKRVEKALRESEEKYRQLVKYAPAGISEIDIHENRFTSVNDVLCDYTGYTKEKLLTVDPVDIFDEESRASYLESIGKVLAGEEISETAECKIKRKDGQGLSVLVNFKITVDEAGRPVRAIGVIHDITKLKLAQQEKEKLEAQLQQAQRLESLGRLAGGVAHDFNNLLMGIQGRTSLMLMDIDPNHSYQEHLHALEDYVENAAELTRQLLGFARGGKYDSKPTDLNGVLKKSSEMFGRTRKEITIHSKYQEDLWPVEVDQGQIEQVLLNLYVNAWQAMPGGGELYLETENTILDEDYLIPYGLEPGRYVKMTARDTGTGMDKATQQKIFDPFFTTKEMGRGTGLGLASAYSIIKNHWGFINVSSEIGEGATFTIYLPASEKRVEKERKPAEGLMKGYETVLLVDDEEMILEVGERVLEKLGYKVIIARGGKEAVEIYKEKMNEIDLIILDMIMPRMNGGQTFDRLKEINPDLNVLLSSGYHMDQLAKELLARGCTGFIQKPFHVNILSQKLREILDKNRPSANSKEN
ncbi:MAG: response regulator [Pseudomonadota bacterium]